MNVNWNYNDYFRFIINDVGVVTVVILKVGDKVKSLLDGKIYTVEKIDELNKVVRLEEISGMWNLKDFELTEEG